MPDIDDLDAEQLRELQRRIDTRLGLLHTLEVAPRMARELAIEYHEALGRKQGEEWHQPGRCGDAYMEGDQVTYEGELWESEHDFNMYPPDQFGWKLAAQEVEGS